VDCCDLSTASAIHSFLSRWNLWLVEKTDELNPNAVIQFRQGEVPAIPEHFERFSINDTATGYATDTAYCVDFGSARMFADESWMVTVWFEGQLDPEGILLPQLLSHSIPAALRRCQIFELHSGAVIDPVSNKSILLCGPSGSGKSTLTLQLAASGWRYLSDDVVLLVNDERKVKAHGLRRFLALTEHTVKESGLPAIDSLLDRSRMANKHRLMPENVFQSAIASDCYPNVIVFPTIASEETSSTHDLTQTETMSRLIRVSPWSCYDRAVAREFLDLLAKLVRQSVSFALSAGSDLIGDPAYTARYLSSRIQQHRS
jgi:hypothetical protein